MVRERHRLIKILASILCIVIFMSFLPFTVMSGFVSQQKETFTASVTLTAEDYNEGTIGPPGGSVYLGYLDKETGKLILTTGIEIPAGALTKWVRVYITRKDPGSLPKGDRSAMPITPISAYEFGAYEWKNEKKGEKIDKLMFKKSVTIILAYEDGAGILSEESLEERLRIFWRDLLDWRLSGGEVDRKKNIVTAKNVMHLSKFALFPIRFGLSADAYRPVRKIITPALRDGMNDEVEFENLTGEFTIRIYDITGKRIRTLHSYPIWDGTDDDGDIVESGIYIYQLKVDGKVVSGVIAVAK